MKKYILILLILLSLLEAHAQIAQVRDPDAVSELIYGISINTNGGLIGSLMMRHNKVIKPKIYRSIGLEIAGVKSPKESRNQSFETGNTYIIGKRNYLYSIRPQYGRDIILFRKAPEEGVQVSATFAAGPSIGLLVPYHILYRYPTNEIRSEQYDPTIHVNPASILGTGGFLEGLGNSNVLLGANLKAGLSLDFGAFRNNITGVEAGFTFEIFAEDAELIGSFPGGAGLEVPNKSSFAAAYVTFFFGTRK